MELTRQSINREAFLARIINRRMTNSFSLVVNEMRGTSENHHNEETQEETNRSSTIQSDNPPAISTNFPDFRTYPLKIDWREVEKGKSYAYEAMDEFGFLGVSIYTRLARLNKFDLNYKKIPLEVLEIYCKLQKETDYVSMKKLKCLIEELPSMEDLENLMLNSYITNKEVFLYKLLLDIYYHYYTTVEFNRQAQFKVLSVIEYLISEYLGLAEIEELISSSESLFVKKIYRALNLSAANLMDSIFIKQTKQNLHLMDLKEELIL